MRLCFVLPELRPSGGVNVVLGHAERLAVRGYEVELVLTDPAAPPAPRADLPVIPLAEARGRRYDLAVATWWRTAPLLWELESERRALFLQSLEHRFYRDELFDALAAEAVLSLPAGFVVVSGWIASELEGLRPDATVHVVRNGIDKAVFGAHRREHDRDAPLRVLVEGQPTLWFKGVADAVAAARAMTEPAHVTLVALDPAGAEGHGADRVVGGLDATGMAELYADSDVLLKLSRVEGLGMGPVEAFHAGVPCVVFPYTSHEEYVEHGRDGFVAEFDDLPAVTGWLDLLARDRDLLARLSANALERAAAWPDEETSTDGMAAALTAIAAEPQPDPSAAWSALWRAVALRSEVGAERLRRLHYAEAGLETARAHVVELSESRDECAQMLGEARDQLAAIRSTRSYRAFATARRLAGAVRR